MNIFSYFILVYYNKFKKSGCGRAWLKRVCRYLVCRVPACARVKKTSKAFLIRELPSANPCLGRLCLSLGRIWGWKQVMIVFLLNTCHQAWILALFGGGR